MSQASHCATHRRPRPCSECAAAGYGGAGRGQGRKPMLQEARRVLVMLEAEELAAVEARWPGRSRSAAVREAVRTGLAKAVEAAAAPTPERSRPSQASRSRAARPRPVPASPPVATRRLRRAFRRAGEGLEALRGVLERGEVSGVRERVASLRRQLSAIASQLRKESVHGVVGDWRRGPGSPAHTELVAGMPEPTPRAGNRTEAAYCRTALTALRQMAQGVEDGAYDRPLSRDLSAVRHQLTLLVKRVTPQLNRRRPDVETAAEVLRRSGKHLFSPGTYEGWWIDGELLEELARRGELVHEPWEEGGGADYFLPEVL